MLRPAATISFQPVAVPTRPKGPTPVFLQSITIASGIMIIPRDHLILLRGHFVTIVANPKDPIAAHTYMMMRKTGSQSTEAVKMNASKITGKVSPTFNVPGISISSIWLNNLYMNVDGA